jgi:hypothetical protein
MKAIKHVVVVGVVDFGAIQVKVGYASPIDLAIKASKTET